MKVKKSVQFFLNSKIKSFIQIGTGGEYGKLKSPHNEKNKWEKKFDSTYSKAKYLATKHLINLFKKKFSMYYFKSLPSLRTQPIN